MIHREAVRQLLIQARKVLENPEHWTVKVRVRDKIGFSCSAFDERAYSFCINGALERANFLLTGNKTKIFIDITSVYHSISMAQDRMTHSQVLAWIDRAIALTY